MTNTISVRRYRRTIAAGAALSVVLAGCGSSTSERRQYGANEDINYTAYGSDYPSTTVKDVSGPCSYEEISKKDYSGVTLKVIANAVPVMGEPAQLHAKQFAALTGADVQVVNVPFGELYQKIMTPLQAGQPAYDVMLYPSLWIGDMAPYLSPVPQKYLDTPGMKDVTAAYMNVATWQGQVLQYPIDGDRHYLKVRSDVLADPANQQEYKAKFGTDLEIPKTWEEYQQEAEFLTGRPFPGGAEGFGSAEVTKRDDLMFSAFISRSAAYAKNPNVKSGFFFDVETMTPRINNEGFVKALDMFVQAKSTWPPGGENFGLGDEILAFGGGKTAFAYSWDDAFVQAQQPDSSIRNKVQAAQLPGSSEVWNAETNAWDKTPNQPAYFTWGWTSGVAKDSKNQDAAFDYLCFFSNEANTALDLTIGRFGVNPYRNAHFQAKFWEDQGWSKETAESYTKTFADMEKVTNQVYDLRVPGVNQYMSALAAGVADALAGKSSQEALDDVAKQWEQITTQVGKDKVQAAYREVVKIENGTG